jgi:hypothetical protein
MNDDMVALLRSLPPDLVAPADRVAQVRARMVSRRRRVAVAVTVLAVVAVTVPLSVLLAGRTTPAGPTPAGPPLTCPSMRLEAAPSAPDRPQVPELPRGVDGHDRLVPPQPPTGALVCAYRANLDQDGRDLTGSRQLSGGLDRLTADLTLLAPDSGDRACTLIKGPSSNYLLGLTYDGGTLWVSATDDPNHCTPATNGQFSAANDISKAIAASYDAGTWTQPVSSSDPQPCRQEPVGRLGQDTALVPPGAVSVEICTGPESGRQRSVTVTSGFTSLVDALNDLPTRHSGWHCIVVDSSIASYVLQFRYAEGPSVIVNVLGGCQPAILNGNLVASDAGPVVPQVEQLLATG